MRSPRRPSRSAAAPTRCAAAREAPATRERATAAPSTSPAREPAELSATRASRDGTCRRASVTRPPRESRATLTRRHDSRRAARRLGTVRAPPVRVAGGHDGSGVRRPTVKGIKALPLGRIRVRGPRAPSLEPPAPGRTHIDSQRYTMFAGLRGFETSLRPSLRARRATERLERRRAADARMIRRTLADGDRPFVGRGPRYLIRPAVLRAAASDLRAVEAALADERRPVSARRHPRRRRAAARRHLAALRQPPRGRRRRRAGPARARRPDRARQGRRAGRDAGAGRPLATDTPGRASLSRPQSTLNDRARRVLPAGALASRAPFA